MQDLCLNVDFIKNVKFPRLFKHTKKDFLIKHLDLIYKGHCKCHLAQSLCIILNSWDNTAQNKQYIKMLEVISKIFPSTSEELIILNYLSKFPGLLLDMI